MTTAQKIRNITRRAELDYRREAGLGEYDDLFNSELAELNAAVESARVASGPHLPLSLADIVDALDEPCIHCEANAAGAGLADLCDRCFYRCG